MGSQSVIIMRNAAHLLNSHIIAYSKSKHSSPKVAKYITKTIHI